MQLRFDSIQPETGTLFREYRMKFSQMIPPPSTLGGRTANAAHRLSAFLHSLHFVSGDFRVLRLLLVNLVSINMGVESLLTKLEPFSLSQILPFFNPHSKEEAETTDVQVCSLKRSCLLTSSTLISFPNADAVCLRASFGVGLLHVIHNASEGLASCVQHYDAEVDNMAELAKFLRERHSKERLISKCFSSGNTATPSTRRLIEVFASQCYKERWGTVAKCAWTCARFFLPCVWAGTKWRISLAQRMGGVATQQNRPSLWIVLTS